MAAAQRGPCMPNERKKKRTEIATLDCAQPLNRKLFNDDASA